MTDPTWQPAPMSPMPQQFSSSDPNRRPGTAIGAAVVTWVFSGIALLGSALFALSGLVARDDLIEQVQDDEAFDDLGVDASSFVDGMVAFSVVIAVLSILGIVMAVLAFRGSVVGRILLVVMSGLATLIALVASITIIPFAWVIAAVSVIVMLFTGGANAWYDRRSS